MHTSKVSKDKSKKRRDMLSKHSQCRLMPIFEHSVFNSSPTQLLPHSDFLLKSALQLGEQVWCVSGISTIKRTTFSPPVLLNIWITLSPFSCQAENFCVIELEVIREDIFPESVSHVLSLEPVQHGKSHCLRLLASVVVGDSVIRCSPSRSDPFLCSRFVPPWLVVENHGLNANQHLHYCRLARLPHLLRFPRPSAQKTEAH